MHICLYTHIYTIFFQIKTFCLMSMLVADCTSYLGANSFFGEGAIVATLTSMPYYASINTSIQCLFTFDFMYTAVICDRSPLEGARYSPIYFYPTCSLKIIFKAIVRIFFRRCIHLASGLGVCTVFLITLGPLRFFILPSRNVGQL